jgi:hypothetical protein
LYSLLDMYVFRNGASSSTKEGSFNIPYTEIVYEYIVLLITSRREPRRKYSFSLLYPIVVVEICLFGEPLLSNGSCIFTYLVQQLVYLSIYLSIYVILRHGS